MVHLFYKEIWEPRFPKNSYIPLKLTGKRWISKKSSELNSILELGTLLVACTTPNITAYVKETNAPKPYLHSKLWRDK